MATAANSDIRRLYSWWWDSHISRKNSKWLEENLKDMDMKVSMMVRLLEEDGDSFARKAEMYFKKRPELLKLVEEFYRAYRALAERYDHATVALRQAHRTIQEAFPNQVPSTPSDTSNSVSSEPQTPDDPPKEAFDTEMPNFVSTKSNGKARKVLNFLEEEGKGYNGSDFSLKKEMGNGDDREEEIAIVECQKLSEKISNLELEISRAREENEKIKSELERCLIFEEEVNALTKQMNERGEEIETLKLKSKETELKNQSLAENFDKVKGNNEDLIKELISTQEELKEECSLKVKVKEALQSSEKLNLRYQEEIKVLFSDLQSKAETLNDFDGMNRDLQDKVEKLKEENESVNTEILSSSSTIKNLQDEISTLEETRVRLEDEAQERENEKAALQQKVRVFQDEIADLELKLKCIIDQIEGIGLSEESFQVSVSEMQRENRELKESCEKYEDEKVFLVGNLEEVNEKSASLEKSLLQVTGELQGLKVNARSLEDSCDSLNRRIGELSTENGILADQMERSLKNASVEIGELKEKIQSLNRNHEDEKSVLLQNIERETEKGVLLEISLSKTSDELEREREAARSLEESCASLINRVQELISENESLSQQFNVCAQSLSNAHKDTEVLREKLESMNLDLEGLRVSFNDKEAVLIGQLEKASEKRTYVEKSLSETTSQLESLILKERSLEESCDSLKRRMEDIIAENGNLENSLKEANDLINELRETKAVLLDQSEKEKENRMFLEKALSETRSELDSKRESCESLNIRIQELSMENVNLSQRLIFSTTSMEDASKNNALLESSLSNANAEIEGLREKIQSMREKEAVLIVQLEEADEKKNVLEKCLFESTSEVERLKMKKRSLEESCDSLNTKITEVTAKNSSLLENNATLDKSLSDALIEVELLRKKVQSLDESLKSLNEENSNLLSEKISLTSELENSCSSANKATERYMGLEEKHLNLERERESTLLLVGEMKSLLTLSHQELARLSEEHLDLQIRHFIIERQLLHAAESFQKHLNLFSYIKRDNLEQEKVINSISVHNKNLQDGIQIALETLGIENSSKNDALNFQSIITEFKEIKRISDIIDDNFSLVLGDTVKSTLMREMGLDLMHLKSENSEMAEQLLALKIEKGKLGLDLVQFKSENVKIAEQMLTLKTENDALVLDLINFKSENSEMVEKLLTLKREKDELGLELLHLKSDNSEMTDQLLILKREKHELLQSNEELTRVLNESQKRENQLMAELCALENVLSDHRDQIKNLEEENTSSLLEALSMSFLSLLFEQLASEREMLLTESAKTSSLLETQNGVLEDLVSSLNQQVEIGRNLLSHKDLEFAEALQRFKASEDTIRDKLKDSLFLIEESDCKIRELMDEIGFYENEASKLWGDTQVFEVYVQIFEDKIHELMEECGNLKERVIMVQKASDSLESELTAYLPLVLILQESMRCLEKEILSLMRMYGMKGESEQETSSTNSELAVIGHPSEQNPGIIDLNGFLGLQKLQLQIKSLQELIKSSVSSISENKNKDIAPVSTNLVSQQSQESGQDSTNGDGLTVNSNPVRENLESEDQMLRLWETAERETGLISSELMREKRGVDQTGIPGKVSSRRDWSRRISDRLSSDAQRLLTLHKSIEELKTQLEKSLTLIDKSTELKYVAVIGRLKRFDEEISELVNANADSTRRAKALTGGAVDQKKQVVEEVQSGSEKIGRLEMELQKIHYVVLKVNEERETKVKGGRKRSRTVLRDYLYGRGKGPEERRWGICTGCIRSNAVRN